MKKKPGDTYDDRKYVTPTMDLDNICENFNKLTGKTLTYKLKNDGIYFESNGKKSILTKNIFYDMDYHLTDHKGGIDYNILIAQELIKTFKLKQI
jgi:hypothetical protein